MLAFAMFDKFDVWQYRDDRNCWDFVREFLIERLGVSVDHAPIYDIHPDDKKAMTLAARGVAKNFDVCDPEHGAVACHYQGNAIIHVGVIDGNMVRHTGRDTGTMKSTIAEFEGMAQRTEYRRYKWHNSTSMTNSEAS